MSMNSLNYFSNPYPIQRNATFARNGMVATSQQLAADAGMTILKKGGNAVDAAIATAACLTVVQPTPKRLGGALHALVWINGRLHCLNGSGRSPKSISIDAVKEQGHEKMPKYGWIPVTIPGAPGAWAELSKKFGNLPLTEVLKPAITYAKEGYPLSPTLGKYWKRAHRIFMDDIKCDEFSAWFKTFKPEGRAPRVGEIWASEGHARTLDLIAETNAEAFYHGELAEKIASFS